MEEAASRFEAKASFWRQRLESAGRLTPSRGPDSPAAESSDGGSARSGTETCWHTPMGRPAGERSPTTRACQGEQVQAAIEAAAELGEQSP